MKKVWITIILLALLLSACNGGNIATTQTQDNATTTDVTTANAQAIQGTPDNAEFPEIAKVLLGSFLLEDTDYAISSDQAGTLYPLWKGLSALQNSDTVTNEELQGLYDQITESMTAEQMAQIDSMDINQDSMRTVMESIGLGGGAGGPGGGGNFGDLTEEQIATMQAEREANGDSGFPGGGPDGAGGRPDGGADVAGMAGGAGGGPGGDAGMMAMGAATDGTTVLPEQAGDPTLRLMSRLFEPLIELLQSKLN